ncbi:MAG TPA: hypothetical protein VMT18_02080 [Planctomycetota bacterium]|nr:hypothetical protein [Planctomycetota bacterium]
MVLALLLTALATGLPARGQEAPASRLETFVLEQVDPLEAGDPWALLGGWAGAAPETVGFLSWRRSAGEAGPTLEWDLRFSERETRLLEVERGEAGGAGLVYREMQPHAGRTLSAEWIDDGTALRLREWGGPQGLQLRLEDCAGGRFRLSLLEELRGNATPPRSARVFDPLSRRFEHLTIDVEEGAVDGPWAGARLVRLSRADGSSAGAWFLRGEAVLGFQWQAGGLRARRIDAEEYSRRLEELAARRAAEDAGAPIGDAKDAD